ncbi:hypothetical protein [Thermococcus sp. 21S9]|uniref:hypothetical protein n=1 Tax=Thermococcus sp. 21S9 TaxID=1638223 RepID=UPI00143C5EB0|nr:hypothetical protein [Thermococcus sp. 21S9]NJE54762.1 hypothetical protein [Thermococcus sp. 21S9]
MAMDFMSIVASVIFAGFAVRTVYLLLREERKKDLLLTTALWGLALFVWGLYIAGKKGWGISSTLVILSGVVAFSLSLFGLFKLREESPKEFGKEL